MPTTTYLSADVVNELGMAQAVIEQHLAACQLCTVYGRCAARREADAVFNRYGQLPRRTPGRTRAGLVSLR